MRVGVVAAAGGFAERLLKAVRFPVAAGESRLCPIQFIGKVVEGLELLAFEHRPHVRLEGLLPIGRRGAPTHGRRRLVSLARCLRDAAGERQGRETDDARTDNPQENPHRRPLSRMTCRQPPSRPRGIDAARRDPIGRAREPRREGGMPTAVVAILSVYYRKGGDLHDSGDQPERSHGQDDRATGPACYAPKSWPMNALAVTAQWVPLAGWSRSRVVSRSAVQACGRS